MKIKLGKGCVLVNVVNLKNNESIGLLLKQTCEPHEIGLIPINQRLLPINDTDLNGLREDDILIEIETLESARVLQDAVNLMCIKMRQKLES